MGARQAWRGTVIVAAAGLLALGGCARPVGDLGRARPDALHDTVMPAIGREAAKARGEPVSRFNLTDEEQVMHDRVWRFLVSPHARDWFYDTAVELQRTRLTAETDSDFTPDRYYAHLRSTAFASSAIRYSAVGNDIWIDLETIPETFAAICAVIEIDRQRAVAVANVAAGAPDGPEQVAARRHENQRRIAWFTRALRYRYESYSLALDRLLVETPNEAARAVDTKLESLAIYVQRAESGAFCEGRGAGAVALGESGIPSRLSHPVPPPEPLYRK